MTIKMTRAVRDDYLASQIAALGQFDPASVYIGVAKVFTDKGLDTTIAEFTEGTGAKFARQKVVAWGAPHDLVNGSRAVDGPMMTFSPSADTDAMQVVAWFAADALVAGNPLFWDTIVPPINLATKEQSISIVPRLTINPDGDFVFTAALING